MLGNWEKDLPHWGPFIRQDTRVFGLVHRVSPQQADNEDKVGVDELFYDDKDWTTFITCKTYHPRIAPFDTFAHYTHYFVIPTLKVVAEATYVRADLSRWREIEDNVRKIVDSFVVR